jgi:hypothetical protein
MNFFIASPWRNKDAVRSLTDALALRGHAAYSFLDSGANGATGRSVIEEFRQFCLSLADWENDPRVEQVFACEMRALKSSDALILLEPAGHSSLTEAGIAYGMGKKVVLIGLVEHPEIVYRLCASHYPNVQAFLGDINNVFKPQGPRPSTGDVMTATTHTVNADATPRPPSGWTIESHRGMGETRLELRDGCLLANSCEVTRFVSERQKTGSIRGYDLATELVGRPVLNATVLDCLIAHQDLIPEDWKTGATYFWGTIFRDSGGRDHVRCLYWRDDRWDSFDYWLDNHWLSREAAAVLAA